MKLVGYIKKDSMIHSLDPRVKIGISIAVSALALIFNHPLIIAILFLSVVIMSLLAHIQKEFKSRMLPMMPIAVSAFLLWILFYRYVNPEGTHQIIFNYAFIIIDRTSILYAIAMSLRVLTLLSMPLLFFATTTFSSLSLALVKLKVPYLAAFIVALSLRFMDYGLEEMNVIRDAQVSRGLRLKTRTMIERPQNIIMLFKPLMEKFMMFQQYLTLSMDLRAFGSMSTRTFYLELKMRKQDCLVLTLVFLTLLLGIYLRVGGLGTIA